jgi:hypothetical protein
VTEKSWNIYDYSTLKPKTFNLLRRTIMKKTIVILIALVITCSAFAQQTVVIKQNGILTDLATAVIGVPAAAATGLIEGTANAVSTIVSGRTTVVTTPGVGFPTINYRPPCPPPAPVVVAPAPAPVVVAPAGDVVIRGRSAYEYGVVPPTNGSTVIISGNTVIAPARVVTTPNATTVITPNPYVRPHMGHVIYP